MLKIAFLSLLPFCIYASGINFTENNWDKILDLAKKQDKIIFLDAYAEWCGPCKLMSAKVFTDSEVGSYFNKNFINVKIDMEKGEGLKLRSQYQVSAYPTLLFITPAGEIVQKKVGALNARDFLLLGKSAFRNYDRSEFYAKQYEEGNRDLTFLLAYIKSLNNANKSPIKVANEFINTHSGSYTEKELLLIYEAAVEIDSKVFEEFTNHYKEIIKLVDAQALEEKILDACIHTARKANEFNADFLLKDVRRVIKKYLGQSSKNNPELQSLLNK
ncbi:MAG: thioredoxin family protein [Saprospiraceae bacterium]|jgi:thiol-disulfide isomerase/thioredoxin